MVGGKLMRKVDTTRTTSPMTPPPSAKTSPQCRWSWSSNKTTEEFPPASKEDILSPDDEVERLENARTRLARREIELSRIIRHANDTMDLVRRKLCKDLQLLEILKEEIEKAGNGAAREQLEQDFHDEYISYVATLRRQKDQVEEMQGRKRAAMKEIEGIKWSDEILARRIQECQEVRSL